MAKTVSQTMEELRQEVAQEKQRAERLRLKGQFSEIHIIERWIKDAEAVLARWDNAG
jgi:hypothetical protein